MTPYDKLRKIIEDIIKLGNLDPKDPKFEKWVQDTKQFLKSEYFDESKNSKRFSILLDSLNAYFMNPDNQVLGEAIAKNLDEVAKLLGALLAELLHAGIPDS